MESRRGLLKIVGGAIATALGLLIAAPAAVFVSFPARRRTVSGGEAPVEVADLTPLAEGEATQVAVVAPGYRALIDSALDEPVPGGARVAYVFGSALVFLLILQFTTGILLAAFYAPSVSSAWAAVAYLQTEVSLGWFIRGLHASGASAMLI